MTSRYTNRDHRLCHNDDDVIKSSTWTEKWTHSPSHMVSSMAPYGAVESGLSEASPRAAVTSQPRTLLRAAKATALIAIVGTAVFVLASLEPSAAVPRGGAGGGGALLRQQEDIYGNNFTGVAGAGDDADDASAAKGDDDKATSPGIEAYTEVHRAARAACLDFSSIPRVLCDLNPLARPGRVRCPCTWGHR